MSSAKSFATNFSAVAPDLFFSRHDARDPRLGEFTNTGKASEAPFVLLGYPDDEGIRLGGGRPGATHGPDAVRRYLYRMTPALHHENRTAPLVHDMGNLHCEGLTLAERHEIVEQAVHSVLQSGQRALSLGGGHDYGFPDAAGFIRSCLERNREAGVSIKPLVINFDAHLDVRPLDRGLTSGTPFFRMLERFPETDFVTIGVQEQCNARAHLDWLKERGGHVITYDEIRASGIDLLSYVCQRLESHFFRSAPRPAFLSIDIDGFSSAYAMGCSQSWATGFNPDEFLGLLLFLLRRLDVKLMSLYEVSPPLDRDDQTAKLAALLAHRYLFTCGENS